jgi:hypothetical protein
MSRKYVATSGKVPYAFGMTSKKNLDGLAGKRREIAPTEAIRFGNGWPANQADRIERFRDWRYTAMQVLHRNGGPFRLMGVYDEAMSWDNGEIWASDEDIAVLAGHCGPKTISREVAAMRRLGLIIVELGWRDRFGKMVRTRKIRMAIPKTLPIGIHTR